MESKQWKAAAPGCQDNRVECRIELIGTTADTITVTATVPAVEPSEDPDSSYYQSGDYETVKTEIKGLMRAWTPSEDVLMRLAIDVMAEILSEIEPPSRGSPDTEQALRNAVMNIVFKRDSP